MLEQHKHVRELWDQYNDLNIGSGFAKRGATDQELVRKRAPILQELSNLDLANYPDEIYKGLFALLNSLLNSIKIGLNQDFDKEYALLFFTAIFLLTKLVLFAARPEEIQVSSAIEALGSVLLKLSADDSLLSQASVNKRAVLTAAIIAFGTLSKTSGIMTVEEVSKISETLEELQKKLLKGSSDKSLEKLTGAVKVTLSDLQTYGQRLNFASSPKLLAERKEERGKRTDFISVGALPGTEPALSASVSRLAAQPQASKLSRILSKSSLISGIALGVVVALVIAIHFIIPPISLISVMVAAGYSATTVGVIFGLLTLASAGLIAIGKMFSSTSTAKGLGAELPVAIPSDVRKAILSGLDRRKLKAKEDKSIEQTPQAVTKNQSQ